ncbi:MAG: hypothetical protein ACYDH1_12615 [Anaerolineaceae bacterium]
MQNRKFTIQSVVCTTVLSSPFSSMDRYHFDSTVNLKSLVAKNFYSDLIFGLVIGTLKPFNFIDPTSICNLEGMEDPKIKFHQTIKELETRLGDPNIRLESFIISNTRHDTVAWWAPSKEEFESHHVLFQTEDKNVYIKKILDDVLP